MAEIGQAAFKRTFEIDEWRKTASLSVTTQPRFRNVAARKLPRRTALLARLRENAQG
jgi:hypothetical protein